MFKFRSYTKDADKTVRGKFDPSITAEREFQRALIKVAKSSGHIVDAHVDGHKLHTPEQMQKALNNYSKLITPWAQRQSAKLLAQVQKKNKKAYKAKANELGKTLTKELDAEHVVGALSRKLLNEQVELIKSIPIEAGLRAQQIAFQNITTGSRATPDQATVLEIQKQLGLTTEQAVNRAKLIAVTETARANASINQSRATAVGSSRYRWHNSGDGAVRDSHKTFKGKPMQGQIFEWDKPPTLDDGMTGNPGTFPRCRCFAEPIFDDE